MLGPGWHSTTHVLQCRDLAKSSGAMSKFENFLLVASHCEPSFPVQDNTPFSIIQLDGLPPIPCQPVRFLPSKSDKNPFSVAWICVAQISVMAQTSDFTLRS